MLQRESYNKEVDVWALGVIVFVLLCGCLPFDDDSKKLNRAGALQVTTMNRLIYSSMMRVLYPIPLDLLFHSPPATGTERAFYWFIIDMEVLD